MSLASIFPHFGLLGVIMSTRGSTRGSSTTIVHGVELATNYPKLPSWTVTEIMVDQADINLAALDIYFHSHKALK